MRWVINLFREKKVLGNVEVLANSDRATLDRLKEEAVIKQLENLQLTSPSKARGQTDLIRLSYWGEKDRASRYDYELQTHYQFFFQDKRCQIMNAGMVVALLLLIIERMQPNHELTKTDSHKSFFLRAGLVMLLFSLQRLIHLNFKGEKEALKNARLHANHVARSEAGILKAVGLERLLEERPCATDESLKPR